MDYVWSPISRMLCQWLSFSIKHDKLHKIRNTIRLHKNKGYAKFLERNSVYCGIYKTLSIFHKWSTQTFCLFLFSISLLTWVFLINYEHNMIYIKSIDIQNEEKSILILNSRIKAIIGLLTEMVYTWQNKTQVHLLLVDHLLPRESLWYHGRQCQSSSERRLTRRGDHWQLNRTKHQSHIPWMHNYFITLSIIIIILYVLFY